jgi:hypothetical protein
MAVLLEFTPGAHAREVTSGRSFAPGKKPRTVQPFRRRMPMKQFLILAEYIDVHADYVSWALKAAGYEATLVNSSHDNCAADTTLYLEDASDGFTSTDWDNAEAAWCRRLPQRSPLDKHLDENQKFSVGEERRFTKWLIEMQHASCPLRWINTPAAVLLPENKFIQLKTARSLGISVPRTLITAQPERFRAFLRNEGRVVAKPLSGYSWEHESDVSLTFATILDGARAAELSDEDIAHCVTMYQQCIDKVADIRIVVMGADMFAYKITQEGEQHFDVRLGFYQENHLKYQGIQIPARLKRRISDLMDSLRINFASADFVLQADGEWVFLDLNPNGQWLFVEESFPESRAGQKFCSFFTKGRVDPAAENLFPSFWDYKKSDIGRSFEEAFRERPEAQA